MALEMLAAYYTRGIHTDDLFCSLEIKHTLNYHKHLNAHNTVCINFNDYFENNGTIHEGIERLSGYLLQDLRNTFPNVCPEHADLPLAFDMVQQATGEKFIFLIDEWDCVFRLKKGRKQEQEEFLSFLRMLFKDKTYVELVYMTGILPIKKYNTGSALNMFREYTILEPKKLGPFFGFTVEETKKLCAQFRTLRLEEVREWYDGYYLAGTGFILNPRSVVEALEEGVCRDYWNKTGGYSELEEYITMDFDGLGSTVAELLAQGRLFFSPDCRDSIREFSLYRWKDSPGGEIPLKEHDHAMDDIRYFVMTVARRPAATGGFCAAAPVRQLP